MKQRITHAAKLRLNLLARLERRALARMCDPSVEPKPVASLLAAPLRKERHRQRFPVGAC